MKESEFSEYKKKVELVLHERKAQTVAPSADGNVEGSNHAARKVMKLEEELVQAKTALTKYNQQVLELQASERTLQTQLTSAKADAHKATGPVKSLEAKVLALESEKKLLVKKLDESKAQLADTIMELQQVRSVPESPKQHHVPVDAVRSVPAPTVVTESVSVQTDVVPPALLMRSPEVAPSPEPTVRQSPSGHQPPLAPVNSQHDSVAIPLRSQIRDLIAELEKEQHDHSLTITQLNVVKEELRKLEAANKLSSDLGDSVKVEYMRNVARKFISLAPVATSDEFEQLIPVILNFFGLEGDEAVRLTRERLKRIAAADSISNSFPFPKLW